MRRRGWQGRASPAPRLVSVWRQHTRVLPGLPKRGDSRDDPPLRPHRNRATAAIGSRSGRRGSRIRAHGWTLRGDVHLHQLHLPVVQFRGRQGARPFYDLVANIAAEEFGHIELVATAINTMLTGSTPTNGRARTSVALRSPLAGVNGLGNPQHFIAGGQGALPQDSTPVLAAGLPRARGRLQRPTSGDRRGARRRRRGTRGRRAARPAAPARGFRTRLRARGAR
jgi:Manganese containing catalase